MAEDEEPIVANFSPSTASTPRRSAGLLANTNPLISSTLFKVYPLFVIINELLEFLLWTSRDPLLNALYLSSLYIIVLFSDTLLSYWYIPVAAVVMYCSVNYYINSVFIDVNGTENPTIDEVLINLENFCIRMEALRAPLDRILVNFPPKKLLSVLMILTPIHILILKYLISPKNFFLVCLIVVTNFHTLWFQATIRLFWRSAIIRKLLNYLQITDSENVSKFYHNYKIIKENNDNGKIIQFQILEHQRRWIGLGWTNQLFPYERSNFTNENLQKSESPEDFTFPFNSTQWQWLEEQWSIDTTFNRNKSSQGWCFYDNYWRNPLYVDSLSSYTRSRKWTRKAVLVITDDEMV
ncbi:hypothetical protein WICPIJ_003634 [Wickerhamomyces pijperi]|uniref:Peroxin/Ferlin domain-containing protein n=1 Tax=Wickerhamomyces pijperi TaxID=599730 RepID=A0A9P8TNI6_WICPI|nr:hypothetical protein WICPIJ_003634 [Wickerhamomyces pijperi]